MKRYALKDIAKDDNGFSSVLYVILAFIVILAITSFTDITAKSWALNEVQSIMDVAGTNTLNSAIDRQLLREEMFGVDQDNVIDTKTGAIKSRNIKNKIKDAYIEQLNANLSTGSLISSYSISNFEVYFTNNDNFGLGTSNKGRPQIVMDAVVKMRVNISSEFDKSNLLQERLYSAKSGSDFTVTYNGTASDGKAELIVRTVSRVVYR